MSDNLISKVEREFIRDDIPDFKPGDTVKVHIKIVEGGKTRIQAFQGIVISRHGSKVNGMFTVRKIGAGGVGVERTFPVNAPEMRINSWQFLWELSALLNSPSLPLGVKAQGMSMAGFDFQRLKCR